MKNYKSFLLEVNTSTIVLGFGRLSPPTAGHGLLMAALTKEAKKRNADHVMYLSKTQDKKKNPLSIDRKLFWAKKSFPGVNLVAASDQIRTFIEAVKAQDGKYKNLVMIAGSDRVSEYQTLLNKYNGKEFNFESISVVSAGERDPDADGAEGMSATKLRTAAANNDFSTFRKGVSNALSDSDARKMMQDVRKGMGIINVAEVAVKVTASRNAFYLGETFKVGQIVKDGDVKFEILDRGSNYVVVVNENGELFRKFVEALTVVEDLDMAYAAPGKVSFKGYSTNFNNQEEIIAAFNDTISHYESGKHNDAVAILRSMKNMDEMLEHITSIVDKGEHADHTLENAKVMEHFAKIRDSLTSIGEFEHHRDYIQRLLSLIQFAEAEQEPMVENMEQNVLKGADKLKVAKIIADTLGVDSSGSSAEMMVNNALRSLKKKVMRPDLLDIIHRMLELAREVNIKFDEKLAPAKKQVEEGKSYNIDKEDHDTFEPHEIEKIKNSHFPDTTRSNLLLAKKKSADRERFAKLRGDSDNSSNLGSPVGSYNESDEVQLLGYDKFKKQLTKHVTLKHPDQEEAPEKVLHQGESHGSTSNTHRLMKVRQIRGV